MKERKCRKKSGSSAHHLPILACHSGPSKRLRQYSRNSTTFGGSFLPAPFRFPPFPGLGVPRLILRSAVELSIDPIDCKRKGPAPPFGSVGPRFFRRPQLRAMQSAHRYLRANYLAVLDYHKNRAVGKWGLQVLDDLVEQAQEAFHAGESKPFAGIVKQIIFLALIRYSPNPHALIGTRTRS